MFLQPVCGTLIGSCVYTAVYVKQKGTVRRLIAMSVILCAVAVCNLLIGGK